VGSRQVKPACRKWSSAVRTCLMRGSSMSTIEWQSTRL
jgi:hypothetical protein